MPELPKPDVNKWRIDIMTPEQLDLIKKRYEANPPFQTPDEAKQARRVERRRLHEEEKNDRLMKE